VQELAGAPEHGYKTSSYRQTSVPRPSDTQPELRKVGAGLYRAANPMRAGTNVATDIRQCSLTAPKEGHQM